MGKHEFWTNHSKPIHLYGKTQDDANTKSTLAQKKITRKIYTK